MTKSSYEVPVPGPAHVSRSPAALRRQNYESVNSPNLLSGPSAAQSKTAYDQTLYTSDPRGPVTVSSYAYGKSKGKGKGMGKSKGKGMGKSGYDTEDTGPVFAGPDGSIGPNYPDSSFRGIANADERGPAPMPNPPVMGETAAPPRLPIRFKDTSYDVSWSVQRAPQ